MEIKDFKKRSSTRDFTKKKFTKKQLSDLTEIINNAPTSTNAQQFAAIIITDEKMKEWMSVKNFHQKHIKDAAAIILFVADRTKIKHIEKTHKLPKLSSKFMTHELLRGVIDATVAAGYAHDAAITMGYGVTYIGGPLTYAESLHKKLNLPESTMVVVGLSIGWPNKLTEFKPKMNKVYMEKYSVRESIKDLKEYNVVLKEYYKKRGLNSNYTKVIVNSLGGKKAYAVPFEAGGKYIQDKWKNYK